MKKTLLTALAVIAASSATAQGKINSGAALLIQEYREIAHTLSDKSMERADLLVILKPGADASALCSYGAEIGWQDNDMAAVSIPVENIMAMSEDDSVIYVEYREPLRPMLNYARPAGNVDKVQDGFDYDGSTRTFTGKGVLASLMDTGLDPNHINFQNSEGESRVKVFFDFTGNSGSCTTYDTPLMLSKFTTDNASETHGTHVAGIMAGSYNGEGTYGYTSGPSASRGESRTGDIPFYGVATGADIAMAGGALSTANISGAVKKIMDFAESEGKPCVVNLSMGSTDGPHDGTDALCRALEAQASRGIIVIAAGNDGDSPLYVTKKLTSSSPELKTFFAGNSASGTIDVWGADATPFKLSIVLYGVSGGKITEVCSVDGETTSANSENSNQFKTYFNGSIDITSGVNNMNNRFNASIKANASQKSSGQNLGIIIEGSDGQEIFIYGNSNATFTNNRLNGWTNGSANGSINDMACMKNVVVVGSYTTRTSWALSDGEIFRYQTSSGFTVGEISPFSSWGKMFGGGWLPNVCAPGAAIVSSYNTYYMQGNSDEEYCAIVKKGRKNNYWAATQGTSMAAPYVAGVIALWLEADPTLTVAEVLDVIAETSISQNTGVSLGGDKDAEKWGAGKIDALAGIKKVLDNSASVGSIFDDDNRALLITPTDNGYEVFVAGAPGINVSIIDMQGRTVNSISADGNKAVVATDHLAAGVYILDISTPNARFTRKIRF